MISLQDFIAKYKDQTGVGNTDQNKGQCVGLVSVWQDNLGVPHEYGNAKDLLTDANTTLFDVIQNDPTNYSQFPIPGDIIVWDDTWGNGFGHTAICVTANGNSFTSFEQNDITSQDTNGACEVLNHADYSGVLGWLHFKQGYATTSPNPSGGLPPNYDEIVGNSVKYQALVAAGYPDVQTIQTLIDNLTQARDNNQKSYEAEVEKNLDLSKQNTSLTTSNTQLKQNVSAVQKQNSDLLQQLSDIDKSDASAIDEGLKAEQALKDLNGELTRLATDMGVAYPPFINIVSGYQDLKQQHSQQVNANDQLLSRAEIFYNTFINTFFKKK